VRALLFFPVLTLLLWGVESITPVATIEVDGTAKDMVLRGNELLIATDRGHIESFDATTYERRKVISIPDVTDFVGDRIPARVLSTDVFQGRYLLLSDSGKGGYSDLYIYEKGTLTKLLGAEARRALIKARFVDRDHILLGYLSDEVALYDITAKKERYRTQLSESKFSDFQLDEKRERAVFSCESGVLSVVDVKSGKLIKHLEGLNVDNVYKVDFKNGTVSAAGQDRRAAIYDVATGKGSYIQGDFLIYATALSPSATQVAFAMDEKNNISVYNTSTKVKTAYLKGQKSTLNVIIFQDEDRLFSASDDHTVMVWNLKKHIIRSSK
jgi:hypothetical protein